MASLNMTRVNGTFVKRGRIFGQKRAVIHIALFVFSSVLLPKIAFSQIYGTATNTITVKVQPITALQINAGIVNLNITGSNAVAGQDQMMTTDQTSTLSWGINSSLKKVTVNTSLVSPKYTLQLVAVNPTVGTAASQVTLSTTANDFLLNIGRSSGSCALLYTAIALASQGTGTDSHTITFTVQTQ